MLAEIKEHFKEPYPKKSWPLNIAMLAAKHQIGEDSYMQVVAEYVKTNYRASVFYAFPGSEALPVLSKWPIKKTLKYFLSK